MNDNRKNTILAIILVLAVGVLFYLLWPNTGNKIEDGDTIGVICTADAMQCENGSWVGRSGPNCQFVCPAGTSTGSTIGEISLQTSIGQRVSGLGVQITPTGIVEDSRCPYDVQCIQAGTVRVRATIVSGLGTSTPIIELGKSITTETETITLVSVGPIKDSTKTITTKEYQFTFKVTKR